MRYFCTLLIFLLLFEITAVFSLSCDGKEIQLSDIHCIKTALQYGGSGRSNSTHSNVITMDTFEDNTTLKYNQGIVCTQQVQEINSHCWNLEPLFWSFNEKYFFLMNFSRQFMDTYLSDSYINLHAGLIMCYSGEPISCLNASNYTLYATIHVGATRPLPVQCPGEYDYIYEKDLLSILSLDTNHTLICLLPRPLKLPSMCLDRDFKVRGSDFLNDFGGPVYVRNTYDTGCCGQNVSFPLTDKTLNVFNLIFESFALIMFIFHLGAPLMFKELRQYPRNLIWFLVLFSFCAIIFHIVVVNLMSSFSMCLLYYILYRFCVMAAVFCTTACLLDLLNSIRVNELIPICKCKPIQYYTMSAKIYRKYCVWFSVGLSVLCVIVDILVSYALSNDSFYHLQLCSKACNMLLFVPEGTYTFYVVVQLLIFFVFIILIIVLEHRLRKSNICACISCNSRRSVRMFWKVLIIFLLPWFPKTLTVFHNAIGYYLTSFVLSLQSVLIVAFFTCISSVRETVICFVLRQPRNAYTPSVIS